MPIYVYKNLSTGERFEIEQRITEPPLVAHPETGDPVKRLVQPVGIAFKGSGFYATDSRASGSSKPAAKETPADGASGTGKDAAATKSAESGSSGKADTSSKAGSSDA